MRGVCGVCMGGIVFVCLRVACGVDHASSILTCGGSIVPLHHATKHSLREDEKAKLCITLAYTLNSLYYMLLRTRVSQFDEPGSQALNCRCEGR